jgi:hypothetical protein
MRISVLVVFTAAIILACEDVSRQQQEPVARAFGSYLYREDLAGIFPANINQADSIRIARQFIERWIRNQLYLRLAETNLPEDEKNVEKQIENFRASLLIHKYQQYLLGQNLDTIISMNEINNYYDNHPGNFVLHRPAITGIYIKIPISAPDRDRILTWFRGDNDLIRLENYAARYAAEYLFFVEEWVYLNDVFGNLPSGSREPPDGIPGPDHIAVTDDEYQYFIGITGFLPARSQMPLSLASRKIKTIILNQRKIKFLNELEKSVMTEGSSKNYFQYFQ